MFKASKLYLLLISPMIMLLSGNISAMYSDPTYLQLPDSIKAKIKIPTAPNMTDSNGLRQGQWIYTTDAFMNNTDDSSKFEFYQIWNYEDGKSKGAVKCYYLTGEYRGEFYVLSEYPPIYDSTYVHFYKNGQKQEEGRYENGKIVEQKGWLEDGAEDLTATAFYLYGIGKFIIADSLLKIAESLYKHKYGEKHQNYAKALCADGMLLTIMKKYSESEAYLKKSVEIFESLSPGIYREYLVSLNALGLLYTALGKYDLSESTYIKALEFCRKVVEDISLDNSSILMGLGTVYFQHGKYQEAEQTFTKCSEITKILSGENSLDYASVLFNIASLQSESGRYHEALQIAKRVLEIRKSKMSENSPDYLNSLYLLGNLYQYLSSHDEAESYLKQIIEIDSTYSSAIQSLGMLYQEKGKYQEAEILYKKVVEVYKSVFGENHPKYSNSIDNLATLFVTTGRYKEAETLLKKAIEIDTKIFGENNPNIFHPISHLAYLYTEMDRNNEAEALLIKMLGLSKEKLGENTPEYSTTLNNLAKIFIITGRYTEAENYLKKSIEIRKNLICEDDGYAVSISNLAMLYGTMGRYNESEPLLIKAREILRNKFGENHTRYATIISNLGGLYTNMGRYPEAEKLLNDALNIQKNQLGDTSIQITTVQNNLAVVNQLTGKYDEAERYLNNARDIIKNRLGESHPSFAKILNNLSQLYSVTGKYEKALEIYDQALRIWKEQLGENHIEYAQCLNQFAVLNGKIGKKAEADTIFNKSIQLILNIAQNNFLYMNEQQKVDFWKTLQHQIAQYTDFAGNYYVTKPEIACQMADITLDTKGIVLNSTQKALSKARTMRRNLDDWQNTRQFWLHLVQNPQKAKKMGINVDSVGQVAADLEKEISSQSLDFKKAFDTTKIRWGDVRNSLSPNQAAIEVVRNQVIKDSIRYIALITKKDSKIPELVVLTNGKELEESYIKKYANLIDRQRQGLKLTKENLYELGKLYYAFWKPIQDKIQGINTVYVSLDGVYNEFNPNTLLNPETGKYILEEIDLRIVTSTRDLAKINLSLNPPPKGDNRAKLFGAPQFELKKEVNLPPPDTTGLSQATRNYYLGGILNYIAQRGIQSLPGTEIEIKKITNDFKSRNWKVDDYTGDAALEENVKAARNPRILHIATHGVFLKDVEYVTQGTNFENKKYVENPLLRSMLLFAGAENTIKGETSNSLDKDDGILTAFEAMNLDLDNTELVVLSACETGLGEVRNGEGVFGLQRAFQVAGAKSLIMSLWSVSDQATQELMTSFYNKWLSGKEKRAAFREAQMELKQKYPGFYYWGAFVMVGE